MTKQELYRVRELIHRIEDRAAGRKCIYRGEDKDYDKVSSSYYRWAFEDTGINVLGFYRGFVDKAFKAYTLPGAYKYEKDQPESKIQHYGGKTNLIDFTDDPRVALFFACINLNYRNQPGRVILLDEICDDEVIEILRATEPKGRVAAQASVFVRPSNGFIVPKSKI